jgi:hypothetical protein
LTKKFECGTGAHTYAPCTITVSANSVFSREEENKASLEINDSGRVLFTTSQNHFEYVDLQALLTVSSLVQ